MPNAEARVETDRASRYLTQLCKHAGQMGRHLEPGPGAHGGGGPRATVEHTEWSGTDGIIKLAWGQCTLQATPDALILRAEAIDEEHLRLVQDGIAERVEKIGRRDALKLAWQRPGTRQNEPRHGEHRESHHGE